MGPVAAYLGVFARPLLATWIDRRFAFAAAAPLHFLAPAVLMLSLSSAPADVCRGLGKPRWVAGFTLCAAAVAIGTAIAAAPSHGAGGVAFALALGLSLATPPFIMLVAVRMLGMGTRSLIGVLARPVLALASLVALFEVALHLSSGFAMAVAAGVVGAIIYVPSVFQLVLDAREQDALRRNWRSRRSRSAAAVQSASTQRTA
jgi:O-antigen/teichoic acid export membrane protein